MATAFTIPPEAYVGTLVPSVVHGRLRSVYGAVINVELHDTTGPFLVSLIRDAGDWSEYGILLSDTVWKRIHDALPAPKSPISFITDHEPRGHPHPPTAAPPSPGENPALSRPILALLDEVADTLAAATATDAGTEAPRVKASARANGDGGFLPLILPGAETIETASDPFLRRGAAVLRAAGETAGPLLDLSPLIGLGIGFTPSGDDFISGALLTDIFLGAAVAGRNSSDGRTSVPGSTNGRTSVPDSTTRAAAPHMDTDAIRRSLRSTTSGGATLLRLALAGTPPAYQLEILAALMREDVKRVIAIAHSHGHTSGLDALTGVIWMARYLAHQSDR
jgi:hypothetical protein